MMIYIINGPNLNLLGLREPAVYGGVAFSDYLNRLKEAYPGIGFDYFQSNVEGELINAIQEAGLAAMASSRARGYTRPPWPSVMRSGNPRPVVEVHSNARGGGVPASILLSAVCLGVIAGFGLDSYRLRWRPSYPLKEGER